MSCKCLICSSTDASSMANGSSRDFVYVCPNCGQYYADFSMMRYVEMDSEFIQKASAIAKERQLAGHDRYRLEWNDDLHKVSVMKVPFVASYPKTFPERLDRIFLNLARKADFSPIQLKYSDCDNSIFFIPPSDKVLSIENISKILHDEGLIQVDFGGVPAEKSVSISLSLKGIKYALSLLNVVEKSKYSFVAMWFDSSLAAFRQELEKAIHSAGYTPLVVDAVPHNDFIMEKVLNLIKGSRFVIADLTCIPEKKGKVKPSCGVRGGVYFEAGFALGMNTPVIFTCRNDDEARSRIHFDLAQMNTIFWKQTKNGIFTVNGKNFAETLKEHIIYTLGKGPC